MRAHNSCPTCRFELGDIRCLALERVAESLELPCKYQNAGCHDIFPYYGKLKHEQLCRFRPYNCPYAGSECFMTGDIPTLVAHLKDDHKVDMHDGCTFNHRYVKSNPHEVENATWMLTVSIISTCATSYSHPSCAKHFCIYPLLDQSLRVFSKSVLTLCVCVCAGRCSIVLEDSSACTLRHSSLVWHLFT